MMSLPFTIDCSYGGLAETEGLARLVPEGLILEFQVKDSVFGVFKSAPKEILVPVTEIAEATFKGGLFSGAISIRCRRLSTLDAVPGAGQGGLTLRCKRKHRELAQDLASRLGMKALENDIRELSKSAGLPIDPPNSPPVPPSVA